MQDFGFKPLRVINPDMELLGEVKSFTSLQLEHHFTHVSKFELYLPAALPEASLLQRKNMLIMPGRPEIAYIIRFRSIKSKEVGIENELWTIRGEHLKSILGQRIIMPPQEDSHVRYKGTIPDALRYFVSTQAIEPEDPNRVIPGLILDKEPEDTLPLDPPEEPEEGVEETEEDDETIEDLGDGIYLFEGRFQSLPDFLEKICGESNFGWTVELDPKNKQYIFKVLEGADRSIEQKEVPPIIFSTERGTLQELEYIESELDFKNTALVAGQGKGIERKINLIGGDHSGLDRYELFVDARDVENEEDIPEDEQTGPGAIDPEEPEPGLTENKRPRPEEDIMRDLQKRGEEKLLDHEQEQFLEGTTSQSSRYEFKKDWNLGDRVTIVSHALDVLYHNKITSVNEVIEYGKHTITPILGKKKPNLKDQLLNEIGEAKVTSTE